MDPFPQLLLLFPVSVAAGTDLYLTLLLVGSALSFDLGGRLDGGLPFPMAWPVLIGLAVLYVTEAAAESKPLPALLWHNLQLLLRPLGAALLALLLLREESGGVMAVGVFMASVVAAFSHVMVWGGGLVFRLVSQKGEPLLTSILATDLLTLGLLLVTWARPNWGVFFAMILILLGLVFGRSLHGAVRFGVALFADRVWGIVSPARWVDASEFPSWIGDAATLGSRDRVRGARAATWGILGQGRFKDGWILEINRDLLFLSKKGRRARIVPLAATAGTVVVGPIAKTLRFTSSPEGRSALFLQMGLNDP